MPLPSSLQNHWMPFTANRQFRHSPLLLVGAKDMHYVAADGRAILDGTAGLWCVNAGHARPRIIEAIRRQAAELDYAPSFQLSHPVIFELASQLTELLPPRLSRLFFTSSGSEAVDTALKIALAYHRACGQSSRTRLIGRERAYHGTGFGGVSVGGIANNRRAFLQLPGVDHIRHTHSLEHNAFTRGQPAWGMHLADDLEALVALHGAETIAAVIVEPVACSTGVLVPPTGYLERLREISARHGILLIFDEVITAFGRLGGATAAGQLGIEPDMIACAKGLTNGAVPMGAVAVSESVHDAIIDSVSDGVEFFHGYTYSGHPLAAAAALATLETYREEGLFERALALSEYWADAVHSLRGTRSIIDIRNFGLLAGVELAPRTGAPGQRGTAIFRGCFEAGLLVRVTGDMVALSPPLIVEKNHIDEMVSTLLKVIDRAG